MLTLGQAGAAHAGTGQGWPIAIWDYFYNDQPLKDVEVTLGKDNEWPKRFLELLVLSLALGHYEKMVKIEDRVNGVPGKQESPDFFVTLSTAQIVGVEVARLTDERRTATYRLIEKLSGELAKEFENNAALSARFQNVSLTIQVVIRETAGYNSGKLLEAIIKRLQGLPENFIRPCAIDRVRNGDDETLCKHSFSLIFGDRQPKWTEITPHIPNDNVDAEAAIVKLIDKKRGLAYDIRGRPLWLALGIADPWGQYTYPIQAFAEKSYAISPFERLIITDNRRAITTI